MRHNASTVRCVATLMVATLLMAGCASDHGGARRTFRFGITTGNPPIAFKEGGEIRGFEVDCARLIASEFGREAVFVELAATNLVPSLLAGNVRMILPGAEASDARRERVNLTEPYLSLGLGAMIRASDVSMFGRGLDIRKAKLVVAAETGTPGAEYMRRYCFGASEKRLVALADAPSSLRAGEIDIFIHDLPVLQWVAGKEGEDLCVPDIVLIRRELTWGIRKSSNRFLRRLNRLIRQWKEEGRIERTLRAWKTDRKDTKPE